MKTQSAIFNPENRKWLLIDATKRPLGRLATQLATLLRGKHKPEFTPHVDTGDFVVVINAKAVGLTGRKLSNKKYFSHSGFFGSLKTKTAKDLSGTKLIRKAVYGMLPKNKLRDKLIKKLKIYEDSVHPHKAQKPQAHTGGAVSSKQRLVDHSVQQEVSLKKNIKIAGEK